MINDSASSATLAPLVLTVPGLGNSGPGHWQTLWEEQRADCRRVELGMWDQPHRNTWANQLNLAIRAAANQQQPIILAAHSLGCLAVAWWAKLEASDAGRLVAGALLVAPPEAEQSAIDHRLAGFAPVPTEPLPFPAVMVASRDDPYMDIRKARRLAGHWGADFADAGEMGHINAASKIGNWPFGQSLLGRLLENITPSGSIATDAPARAGEASRLAHGQGASPAKPVTDSPTIRG